MVWYNCCFFLAASSSLDLCSRIKLCIYWSTLSLSFRYRLRAYSSLIFLYWICFVRFSWFCLSFCNLSYSLALAMASWRSFSRSIIASVYAYRFCIFIISYQLIKASILSLCQLFCSFLGYITILYFPFDCLYFLVWCQNCIDLPLFLLILDLQSLQFLGQISFLLLKADAPMILLTWFLIKVRHLNI